LPGGKHLSSEDAAAMARKRWDKKHDANVTELLLQAGFDNPEDAPATLRLLAEKAVQSSSGSVTALVQFVKSMNNRGSVERERGWDWRRDPCPTCGSWRSPHPEINKVFWEHMRPIVRPIWRELAKIARAEIAKSATTE